MAADKFYHQFLSLTGKALPEIGNKNFSEDFNYYKTILDNLPCIAGVFNHAINGYEYLNQSLYRVLGHLPEEFMGEHSIKYVISTLHPDQLPIFVDHVWPTMFNYFAMHAKNNMNLKFRYSTAFLCQKKDGSYIWCMQQITPVELDANGIPVRSVLAMYDLTGIKKDNNVDILVSRLNNDQSYSHVEYFSFQNQTDYTNLSSREMEILELLSKGHSSKEISDKLCISVHTVSSHRKNMIRKCETSNTNELIYFYRQRGLL